MGCGAKAGISVSCERHQGDWLRPSFGVRTSGVLAGDRIAVRVGDAGCSSVILTLSADFSDQSEFKDAAICRKRAYKPGMIFVGIAHISCARQGL
jgi:hypothetical protein